VKRKFYLKLVSGSNLLLLLSFLLLVNCAEKKSPREVIIKTYVENIVAEEAYSFNADSLRIQREKIFKQNGLTQEQFKNELKSYKDVPEAWDLFFKRANLMLDSLKRAGKIS
jgi:hypothetical protein